MAEDQPNQASGSASDKRLVVLSYHTVWHWFVPLQDVAEAALAVIDGRWAADQHENANLDYEQTPDSPDRRAPEKFLKDLAESAVCFANGTGGTLVIGVRDKAPSRESAIVGVNTAKWNLEDIVQSIHSRTSPAINAQPLALNIDGKIVYALHIPEGRDVHSTTEGVYKVRVGNSCRPLEGQQLRGLRTLRQGLDWSSESSERRQLFAPGVNTSTPPLRNAAISSAGGSASLMNQSARPSSATWAKSRRPNFVESASTATRVVRSIMWRIIAASSRLLVE